MRRPRCKEGVKMPKLKVRVVKLEARQGQTGSYAIVHLEGGKRAYVWDRALVQSLGPGLYEVEVEERKGVLRLVSAKPISNGAKGQEERPQEASMAPRVAQERMVALQAAVALAGPLGLRDIGQVLAIAETLMRWLRRET
jgi:hypothetical protein